MHAPQSPVAVHTEYRADIDGLRAISVISVVLFHLEVPAFNGGFVGVDMFFVISGYLIAKLIKDGIEAGTFTLSGFYVRRARRLLPALFVTLTLSFLPAFLLMTPEHFRNFGDSASAAAVSLSNFYFWRNSSYFDLDAQFRPLLHTWSLSVEEQFYVVFPAFFVAALAIPRRWAAPMLIGVAGLVSLLLSISFADGYSSIIAWSPKLLAMVADGPATIFYVPIFRVFEFAIGTLLLWVALPSNRGAEIALAVGFALIGYSVFTYTRSTLFPAANALPPCIGAALCIYGGKAPVLGFALRNTVSVFVGKISYSVYLIHWPALIFYRYYVFQAPTASEKVALFVASIVLGYLSYRFVEQPWRRGALRVPNYVALAVSASLAANIALAGHIVYSEKGWPWRVKDDIRHIIERVPYDAKLAFQGSLNCPDFCEFGNLSDPKIILIIGDSHVDHYTKALSTAAPDSHFKLIWSGTCFMGKNYRSRTGSYKWQHCREAELEAKRWLQNPNVVAVIQSQRWPSYADLLEDLSGRAVKFPTLKELYDVEIADVLALYKDFSRKVVIINSVPNTNISCVARPLYISLGCPIPSVFQFVTFAKMMREAIAGKPQFAFVDPADTICSGQSCQISTDGVPIYSDEHHLSVAGASLIVQEIMRATQPR